VADELYDLMKKNLHDGLAAANRGPEALRKQAEAMFPPDHPQDLMNSREGHQQGREAFARVLNEAFPPPPPSGDKPEMWREGEPMPDWAREALALAPPTTPED
jgi:hypothetical protein